MTPETLPEKFIGYLNTLPSEAVLVLLFLLCGGSLLLMARAFGKVGLFIYAALTVIVGNIQVLTAAEFSFYNQPIALGTVVFSSLFLCSDILTEHYGPKAARKSVHTSFMTLLLLSLFMILTLGFTPPAATPEHAHFAANYQHIKAIFVPIPALLAASLIAYLLSQYNDIWIFQLLRRITRDNHIWLRSLLSTSLSSLVDSVIFSVLAWKVFAPIDIDTHTLIFTYILGTYLLRLALAVAYVPFMYLAHALLPHPHKEETTS